MKKVKAIIVYSIIIALCIAAFTGYWLDNKNEYGSSVDSDMNDQVQQKQDSGASKWDENKPEDIDTTNEAQDNDNSIPEHVMKLMDKALQEPDPQPVVGIGRGDDYSKATMEAVENAGGLDGIINAGDVVLIKPNICTLAEAGSQIITDYRTVKTIADMAFELGASRVVIGEGTITGNAFSTSFLNLNKYDEIENVELINFNEFSEKDCYELKSKNSVTTYSFFIPKIYMDADVVINVAKLKTHFQGDAVVTLSLKNLYGVPPGNIYGLAYKNGLHAMGLKESIVDLNKLRKPEFIVIEGIVGGEGYGPLNNTPVQSDIIFAGRDPVAIDTVASTFMGFTVDMIPHLLLAAEENLGIADLDKIKIIGADLDEIKMDFESSYKR